MNAEPSSATRTVFSGEVELAAPFELPANPLASSGAPYSDARLLVRLGGEPIGFVDLPLGSDPLSQVRVVEEVHRELGARLAREIDRQGLTDSSTLDGLSPGAGSLLDPAAVFPATKVTVAVCTRNRAALLPACLEALRGLAHPELEFVIVDNAPADETTKAVIDRFAATDPRFVYCLEPAAGLSRGRNRALAEASGEIIAFTDDDVRVDPSWVKALLRGFGRRDDVGCVTGMVASASLERPAEQYFDGRVWWSSRCDAQIYDAEDGPAGASLHPYAAGSMGTGANFAVRVDLMRKLGGFDECLGAGSPSGGGEDLDAFVRVIRSGWAIAYEPAALVWHVHRIDEAALRAQMYEYGVALSAFLFKYISSRRSALDVMRRVPAGLAHLGVLGSRSRRVGADTGFDRGLMLAEMKGLGAGPWAYLRARRAQPRARSRAVAP
ncbi:MAG TPA: glycosyltransferase [Solirubrobacterales bacterium]|jgi:glycosyltransferase involved in cell wall biosynthesis|nr:glycosyltransferase [Solirubrobacterales bacterium]